MKTTGIAAGALGCAVATSSFAQSPPPPTPTEARRGAADLLTAPVPHVTVGADLNLFILRAGGAQPASSGNQSLSAFVFAGVEGRFDVGGARVNKLAP